MKLMESSKRGKINKGSFFISIQVLFVNVNEKEEVMKRMIREVTALLAVTLALAILAVAGESAQKNLPVQKDESLRRGETRATLDPGMFSDSRVKEAYRIAKDIPWILDSIYCYCKCEESPAFRHKSLLSCYVDNHAAM
jgi:hypothetical protein